MACGASHMMLQHVFDGAISVQDTEVEQRPYHKNCGCALHNLKGACSNAGRKQRYISFPKKTSWNECCMHTTALKFSSQSSFSKSQTMANREDASMALPHKP